MIVPMAVQNDLVTSIPSHTYTPTNVGLLLSNRIAQICVKALQDWNDNLREIKKLVIAHNAERSKIKQQELHERLHHLLKDFLLEKKL